jgi:MarR family transcriptional regulator, transcriptional regulator for hemolysin
VRRAFDVALTKLGLNLTEASLLSFIRDLGPLTQTELAGHLHIGRASVGSAIDGLARRSLVQRVADPHDRRVWRIHPTQEALALVAAFDEVDAEVRDDLRRGFSREERQILVDLLLRLESNAIAIGEADQNRTQAPSPASG